MFGAMKSGNPILMRAGALDAITVLRIQLLDFVDPKPHRVEIPRDEALREFRALIPVLVGRFEDPAEPTAMIAGGETDYTEIGWKTYVVEFMDPIRATPSSEMLDWMMRVLPWPHERVADSLSKTEELNARIGPPKLTDYDRATMSNYISGAARTTALNVIPVLAHLNPMPHDVLVALPRKIDDNEEPQAAAIHAIGTLKLDALKPRLASLLDDESEAVVGALMDIGVRR